MVTLSFACGRFTEASEEVPFNDDKADATNDLFS